MRCWGLSPREPTSDGLRLDKNAIDGGWTLGTQRFIRESGFDAVEAYAVEYCAGLVDPSTGKARTDLVEDRDCPLCGRTRDRWRPLWTKDGFDFHACMICGVVFVSPVLRRQFTFEMYASSELMRQYFEMMRHPTRDRFERAKYQYALQLLWDLKGWRSGKILDVGCGTGRFLDVAIEAGWQAEGVEIERRCVEDARARGMTIHDRLFRASDFDTSAVNVISCWDVLEHLADPCGLVREMTAALAPGGVAVISVPNVDSLAVRVLHQASTQFCGYSHVNYFGVATLRRLLEDAGLRILHIESYISEVYVVNAHLRSMEPGREESLLSFLTPDLVHEHLMGNKLLAIAIPHTAAPQ
ncbi:MAG: class I SAM-dependent methyltransferase [Chloroflexi bacterium]|nr:class I SAM-dependent methyltransferase [Chloroflexota bacterium]